MRFSPVLPKTDDNYSGTAAETQAVFHVLAVLEMPLLHVLAVSKMSFFTFWRMSAS
jgi:hypothetical protein